MLNERRLPAVIVLIILGAPSAGLMGHRSPGVAPPFVAMPVVHPNPNSEGAGVLRSGTLTLTLEAKASLWYLDGPRHPAMTIEAFSEPGKPPLMPGPLVRVPAGTDVRLTIRNSLSTPLTFFMPAGLRGTADRADSMDSLVIPPGTAKTLATRAEVNATELPHPMHLHGFYYRVDSYTAPAGSHIDSLSRPIVRGQMVVMQILPPFSGMSMTWSPDRPGNWLFHCHTAMHTTSPLPPSSESDDPDTHGMVGMALGTIVAPRAGVTSTGHPAASVRHLSLVAEEGPGVLPRGLWRAAVFDSVPLMHFVLVEQGRRTDTHTDMSPELDLVRGEPVAITIVNHLTEPTTVHWHGIEVEDSYMDGAPGFSGTGEHLTPAIAPGDSFVARFTPPRSGTFMYHAHVDDLREQLGGLEGALIVRDRGAPSSDDHVLFLKGLRGATHPLEINGQANPDTIVLHVGRTARLRFMNLGMNLVSPVFLLTGPAGQRRPVHE